LSSGTRFEAVRLEGDRRIKRKLLIEKAVYGEETGANGDPMY